MAEAWPLLRESDRAALAPPVVPAQADCAEQNRRNVARHRARVRLRALVGPIAAAVGLPVSLRALRPRAAAVASIVPAAITLTLLPAAVGPVPSVAVPRGSVPATAHAAHEAASDAAANSATSHAQQEAKPELPAPPHGHDRHATGPSHDPTRTRATTRPLPGTSATVSSRPRRNDDPLLCLHGAVTICVPHVNAGDGTAVEAATASSVAKRANPRPTGIGEPASTAQSTDHPAELASMRP